MPLTVEDMHRVIRKLKMTTREGKHRIAFFEHDGKQILFTSVSQGRGEVGQVEFAIRKQLKVSGQQLKNLADCPMSRDAYVAHLRSLGLIEPET